MGLRKGYFHCRVGIKFFKESGLVEIEYLFFSFDREGGGVEICLGRQEIFFGWELIFFWRVAVEFIVESICNLG